MFHEIYFEESFAYLVNSCEAYCEMTLLSMFGGRLG